MGSMSDVINLLQSELHRQREHLAEQERRASVYQVIDVFDPTAGTERVAIHQTAATIRQLEHALERLQ